MKVKELQLKSEAELKNILKEKKEQLGGLRLDFMKKQKDTSEIGKIKKDVARIFTILKGRSSK